MNSEKLAFMKAICQDPKDDTPRLVYADWLEEHGEEERAEYIRLSIGSYRGEDIDRERLELIQDRKLQHFGPWLEEILAPILGQRWFSEFSKTNIGLTFWRGFISHIYCSWDQWRKYERFFYWGQTKPCPENYGEGWHRSPDYVTDKWECEQCQGRGWVEEPFPETAQPIEEVVLSTQPLLRPGLALGGGYLYRLYDEPTVYEYFSPEKIREYTDSQSGHLNTRPIIKKILAKRWPKIKFNLPYFVMPPKYKQ